MISWNSLIFCWNSSRVGKAISDSSLIGVPSCFSGGRRMVKCTRSTLASDLSRLRQVRSPACGSPDTSRTRSLSRTPSMETTARLLTPVSSPSRGEASISTMFAPAWGIGTVMLTFPPTRTLRLSITSPSRRAVTCADTAEARSGHEHDAAVALVLVAGDQPVHGRGKAERRDLARHVVHASVGDEDGAGHAVLGNVGERRGQRREQSRAVGLAVRLAGLNEAHLHAGYASEPLRQRRAHRLGLLQAVAELLARALVDDDGGDRGERVAVFAGDRWIGERKHEQREREGADQGGAGAGEHEQERDRERNRNRRPHDVSGYERRE